MAAVSRTSSEAPSARTYRRPGSATKDLQRTLLNIRAYEPAFFKASLDTAALLAKYIDPPRRAYHLHQLFASVRSSSRASSRPPCVYALCAIPTDSPPSLVRLELEPGDSDIKCISFLVTLDSSPLHSGISYGIVTKMRATDIFDAMWQPSVLTLVSTLETYLARRLPFAPRVWQRVDRELTAIWSVLSLLPQTFLKELLIVQQWLQPRSSWAVRAMQAQSTRVRQDPSSSAGRRSNKSAQWKRSDGMEIRDGLPFIALLGSRVLNGGFMRRWSTPPAFDATVPIDTLPCARWYAFGDVAADPLNCTPGLQSPLSVCDLVEGTVAVATLIRGVDGDKQGHARISAYRQAMYQSMQWFRWMSDRYGVAASKRAALKAWYARRYQARMISAPPLPSSADMSLTTPASRHSSSSATSVLYQSTGTRSPSSTDSPPRIPQQQAASVIAITRQFVRAGKASKIPIRPPASAQLYANNSAARSSAQQLPFESLPVYNSASSSDWSLSEGLSYDEGASSNHSYDEQDDIRERLKQLEGGEGRYRLGGKEVFETIAEGDEL